MIRQNGFRFICQVVYNIWHPDNVCFQSSGIRPDAELNHTGQHQGCSHCHRHDGAAGYQKYPSGYLAHIVFILCPLSFLYLGGLKFLRKFFHGLGTVLNFYIHGIHQGRLHRFSDFYSQFGRLFHLILYAPLHGIFRRHAGDHLIKGGRQCIHIRPRSLVTPAPVLLFRRVSGFDNNGKALAVFGGGIPGSAEIQKLYLQSIRLIRVQHVDIVRRNIPVEDSCLMYCFHSRSDLQNDRYGLFHRHLPVFCQIFL